MTRNQEIKFHSAANLLRNKDMTREPRDKNFTHLLIYSKIKTRQENPMIPTDQNVYHPVIQWNHSLIC